MCRSGRTEHGRITSPASRVDRVRIGASVSVGHAVVGAQIDRAGAFRPAATMGPADTWRECR
jgi:hypothetical protein